MLLTAEDIALEALNLQRELIADRVNPMSQEKKV